MLQPSVQAQLLQLLALLKLLVASLNLSLPRLLALAAYSPLFAVYSKKEKRKSSVHWSHITLFWSLLLLASLLCFLFVAQCTHEFDMLI